MVGFQNSQSLLSWFSMINSKLARAIGRVWADVHNDIVSVSQCHDVR